MTTVAIVSAEQDLGEGTVSVSHTSRDPGQLLSDADAFEAEAMPHVPALYRAAVRMTRDATVAEDVVQETLERAFTNFARYQRGTNIRAWLFKILSYVAITDFRRRVASRSTSLEGIEEFNLYRMTRDAGVDVENVEKHVLDQLGEESVRSAIDEPQPRLSHGGASR